MFVDFGYVLCWDVFGDGDYEVEVCVECFEDGVVGECWWDEYDGGVGVFFVDCFFDGVVDGDVVDVLIVFFGGGFGDDVCVVFDYLLGVEFVFVICDILYNYLCVVVDENIYWDIFCVFLMVCWMVFFSVFLICMRFVFRIFIFFLVFVFVRWMMIGLGILLKFFSVLLIFLVILLLWVMLLKMLNMMELMFLLEKIMFSVFVMCLVFVLLLMLRKLVGLLLK